MLGNRGGRTAIVADRGEAKNSIIHAWLANRCGVVAPKRATPQHHDHHHRGGTTVPPQSTTAPRSGLTRGRKTGGSDMLRSTRNARPGRPNDRSRLRTAGQIISRGFMAHFGSLLRLSLGPWPAGLGGLEPRLQRLRPQGTSFLSICQGSYARGPNAPLEHRQSARPADTRTHGRSQKRLVFARTAPRVVPGRSSRTPKSPQKHSPPAMPHRPVPDSRWRADYLPGGP